ncbi:MAG: YdcF family protein [Opitutus sp.]|nr:YdcF family protein [Opitutus sp.]
MPPVDAGVRAAAERALAYLAKTDPAPREPVDAVIGFGVFDLKLSAYCGELHATGVARIIIFTGGIGAGTGSLGGREADVWREALRQSYPTITDEAVIVENQSTNTAENIGFTAELLAREHPALAFGRGVRTAIIVASPSRLRRVQLTMRKLQPEVRVVRRLPAWSFGSEHDLYAANGVDYYAHLAGELDRIVNYPARGWIAAEPLPAEIAEAHAELKQRR